MQDSLAHWLRRALDAIPRRVLAVTPTPLLRLTALEAHLGRESGRPAPRILAKVDAWTGFGLGGNKVRKLEPLLAATGLEGVSCLITAGSPQSNHARVTAAAAAHLGLDCVIVTNGTPARPLRGNARLQTLYGARFRRVERREERDPAMEEEARHVAAAGGSALVIPIGASTPLGALGYVRAALEFADQLRGLERHGAAGSRGRSYARTTAGRLHVFVATSSGGTLAGLWAGLGPAGLSESTLVGVSADASEVEILETAARLSAGALELLRAASNGEPGPFEQPELVADTAFIGGGYGEPTAAGDEATALFGSRAGLLLDPTYTAKAAAGTLDWIREGRVDTEDTVVFWHTGGWPSALG